MSCHNCFKDDAESFEQAARYFRGRRSLVILLPNVVLNIRDFWERYCYCEQVSIQCSACQFWAVYLNNDYNIYENSFEISQAHLQKFNETAHLACELINRKFYYSHRNWFDGKIERFYLPYCLDIYENNKINSIKNNDFKVALDPLPLKKYFFKLVNINFFRKDD